MRFVCVSDTHNQLGKIKLPEGDIIVHSGDWTMRGALPEVAAFAHDLRKAAKQYPFGAVVVAGNHDFLAEKEPRTTKMLLEDPKITYLFDKSVRINGFNILVRLGHRGSMTGHLTSNVGQRLGRSGI